LANSTAEGVALQLESVDKGSVIPPGVPIALAGPVGAGSYSPEFVVKYVKTDAVVKPGSVKASAIFTVTYD
jgi:type 1 fimbria pilin